MNSFLLFVGGVSVGVLSTIGLLIYLIATSDKFYNEGYHIDYDDSEEDEFDEWPEGEKFPTDVDTEFQENFDKSELDDTVDEYLEKTVEQYSKYDTRSRYLTKPEKTMGDKIKDKVKELNDFYEERAEDVFSYFTQVEANKKYENMELPERKSNIRHYSFGWYYLEIKGPNFVVFDLSENNNIIDILPTNQYVLGKDYTGYLIAETQQEIDEYKLKNSLFDENATMELVWPNGGYIKDEKGNSVPVHNGVVGF